MGSRRLAISSLLCDDDQPTADDTSNNNTNTHTASGQAPRPASDRPAVVLQSRVPSPLPMTLQPTRRRRRTPSPPPSHRHSTVLSVSPPSAILLATRPQHTVSSTSAAAAEPRSPFRYRSPSSPPMSLSHSVPFSVSPPSSSTSPRQPYSPQHSTRPRPPPLNTSMAQGLNRDAPFSGLDMLVQAATEVRERRDTRPWPVDPHNVSPHSRTSPPTPRTSDELLLRPGPARSPVPSSSTAPAPFPSRYSPQSSPYTHSPILSTTSEYAGPPPKRRKSNPHPSTTTPVELASHSTGELSRHAAQNIGRPAQLFHKEVHEVIDEGRLRPSILPQAGRTVFSPMSPPLSFAQGHSRGSSSSSLESPPSSSRGSLRNLLADPIQLLSPVAKSSAGPLLSSPERQRVELPASSSAASLRSIINPAFSQEMQRVDPSPPTTSAIAASFDPHHGSTTQKHHASPPPTSAPLQSPLAPPKPLVAVPRRKPGSAYVTPRPEPIVIKTTSVGSGSTPTPSGTGTGKPEAYVDISRKPSSSSSHLLLHQQARDEIRKQQERNERERAALQPPPSHTALPASTMKKDSGEEETYDFFLDSAGNSTSSKSSIREAHKGEFRISTSSSSSSVHGQPHAHLHSSNDPISLPPSSSRRENQTGSVKHLSPMRALQQDFEHLEEPGVDADEDLQPASIVVPSHPSASARNEGAESDDTDELDFLRPDLPSSGPLRAASTTPTPSSIEPIFKRRPAVADDAREELGRVVGRGSVRMREREHDKSLEQELGVDESSADPAENKLLERDVDADVDGALASVIDEVVRDRVGGKGSQGRSRDREHSHTLSGGHMRDEPLEREEEEEEEEKERVRRTTPSRSRSFRDTEGDIDLELSAVADIALAPGVHSHGVPDDVDEDGKQFVMNDAMDVDDVDIDVDNELLSLIEDDFPARHPGSGGSDVVKTLTSSVPGSNSTSASHARSSSSSQKGKWNNAHVLSEAGNSNASGPSLPQSLKTPARATPTISERGSMPPPSGVPPSKAGKASAKGAKGLKENADEKPAKPKAPPKSRSSKSSDATSGSSTNGASSTGAKAKSTKSSSSKLGKSSTTAQLHLQVPPGSSHPSLSIRSGTPTTPVSVVDESFPTFTSSGRIITKSKKVTEGAAAAYSSKGSKAQSQNQALAVATAAITTQRQSMTPPVAVATGTGPPPVASQGKKKASEPKSAVAKGILKSELEGSPAVRSRSHSAHPRDSVGVDVDKEKHRKEKSVSLVVPDNAAAAGGEEEEDGKLYCICKTRYEEDKTMIGCDRCDDWYHTSCVNMPDHIVELVDDFICPICIASNPHLNLKTTFKPRCLNGLKHTYPNSAQACHRPARGAFSKYCSDECGIKLVQSKIKSWNKKGGDVEQLWESIKSMKRSEGAVVENTEIDAILPESVRVEIEKRKAEFGSLVPAVNGKDTSNGNGANGDAKPYLELNGHGNLLEQENQSHLHTLNIRDKREVSRLNARLSKILSDREKRKRSLEINTWRTRVLELAIERAERIGDVCGWDQRLCFGDEEVEEFGEGVLETYEMEGVNGEVKDETGDREGAMEVDEQPEDGAWWCRGKKKCSRHAGWQKLRTTELTFEKELQDSDLSRLTNLERSVRKRVEEIVDPQPAKITLTKAATNTHSITSVDRNGDTKKKGKKKNN